MICQFAKRGIRYGDGISCEGEILDEGTMDTVQKNQKVIGCLSGPRLKGGKRMFELKDVYASYGEGMVLRHVSLEAPKGRVTCLVGRNGAGKTTTLKSVMGLVKHLRERFCWMIREIQDLPVYERAKKGIGYVPQGREIFPQLTVEENILLGLEAKKGKGGIPDFIYETFPILNEFRKKKGRGFIRRPAAAAGDSAGRGGGACSADSG